MIIQIICIFPSSVVALHRFPSLLYLGLPSYTPLMNKIISTTPNASCPLGVFAFIEKSSLLKVAILCFTLPCFVFILSCINTPCIRSNLYGMALSISRKYQPFGSTVKSFFLTVFFLVYLLVPV